MSLDFKRVKEDFKCENCGFFVKGDGYTNHCPHCLWSKHVDKNPGDRLENCEGMMEPIRVEVKSNGCDIIHRCLKCKLEKRNKMSDKDSFEAIINIVKQ